MPSELRFYRCCRIELNLALAVSYKNRLRVQLKVIIDMFPGLGNYLEMLDKAVRIEDTELIEYLTGKIGAILQSGPAEESISSPSMTAGIKGGIRR